MNKKITLVELVELVAQASSTTKRVSELFLRELFTVVSQALIDGESVKIKGVGSFKVTRVKPRKSVNVKTGEPIEIAGYSKLVFTPDKALSEAINQPFAQFESVELNDEVTDDKLAEIDKQYPSLFNNMSSMPEPPDDMPEPPAPSLDDLPASPGLTVAPQPAKPQPAAVAPTEKAAPEPEPARPAEEPVKTILATPIDGPSSSGQADAARPMIDTPLMGIPIDGPSEPAVEDEAPAQPVKEPEPETKPQPEPDDEPEDDFYRPEPRNAYTPTAEQIEQYNKPRPKHWLWIALAVLAAGALLWLWLSPGGKADEPVLQAQEAAVTDSDTVVTEAQPAVVTDIVTSKIVLSTLSEKHYGSPWFWVYIYEENRSIISDPNNVRPGTSVVIPPAEKYGIDAKDPASLKKAQRRSWEILKGK